MRFPPAPAPLLACDGALASAAYGGVIAIVDTRSGKRTDAQLADSAASAIAFAAGNARVVLHANGRVALASTAAPAWSEEGSAECRGAVYRAVLGKEFLVAAIRTDETTMNLGVWRLSGEALAPLGPAEGLALGASAVHHLYLDEANGRVLLGGVSGRGAFSGEGKPFSAIVGLTPDLPLIWKGDGLPFRPESYLYPLAGGELAIAQRNRLARIDLKALPAIELLSDVAWETPLERTALSPSGEIIAWMWAEEGDAMQLRTAKLSDGKTLSRAHFALAGNFPALGVDDDGVATVVAGQRPDQMLVVRVEADGRVETQSITVPSEPD